MSNEATRPPGSAAVEELTPAEPRRPQNQEHMTAPQRKTVGRHAQKLSCRHQGINNSPPTASAMKEWVTICVGMERLVMASTEGLGTTKISFLIRERGVEEKDRHFECIDTQ